MAESDRDAWTDAVARELRRPVRVAPDFDRRVMHVVRYLARRPDTADDSDDLRTGRRWHFSLTLTPVRTVALAAGLAALTIGSGWIFARGIERRPHANTVTETASVARVASPRPVQFVVVAPGAAKVTLVGDFNDWDSAATPMRRESPAGVWSVTVPLSAGRYQYAFVINGREWRADPAAPAAGVNDFGAPNSIVAVTEQAS